MDRVTHESFCRAVVEDNTALLLWTVGSFRKEALCRIGKGSDASRVLVLDQEMSTRLLHLACKHNAVECARLLLEGGSAITPAPVDARVQLTRTPLRVAAETHSARCIQLLLSKNACTDLMSRRVQANWSLDNPIEDLLSFLRGRDLSAVRLLAEKIRVVGELAYRYAMEGRVPAFAMLLLVVEEKISAQVSAVTKGVRTKRSIYISIVDEALSMGDALAHDGHERRKALLYEIQLINQFGSASWREHNDNRTLPPLLMAAKVGDMNVIKTLLMGNVDVNEADSEGNTLLHWCLSGGSRTQEPRIVWLLLKNGARIFQGNNLALTPVHSAAAKGNYKALEPLLHAQDCVDIPTKTKETTLFFAVQNGSARNLRKQRPIDVATYQDMRFALSSANVVPFSGNRSSPQENRVMKKEIYKEHLGDEFGDFDIDGLYYERYAMDGRVPASMMLALGFEEKILAPVLNVNQFVSTSWRDHNYRRILAPLLIGSTSWRYHNDKRALPPLVRAAKVGDMHYMKMFLIGNADVNEADSEGNTPLNWLLSGCSSTQDPRTLWILLKNGTRVFQGNKLGLKQAHNALQALLVHAQGCVDIPNKDKETSLSFAAKNYSVECVELLLHYGAYLKAQNLRKQRLKILQDMGFALSSTNVMPFSGNLSPPQKNHDVISGQDTICGSNNCLTQVFVEVCGKTIALQKNLKSTLVKELLHEAFCKAGVYHEALDFYAIYGGKCLRFDKPIEFYKIVKDSTIWIRTRGRAGTVRSFTHNVQSLDEFMTAQGYLNNSKRFHVVKLSQLTMDSANQDTTVTFLSRFSAYLIHHIMAFICEKHRTKWSYNGNFTVKDIFVVDGRWIIFDPNLHESTFNQQSCSTDFAKLHEIFSVLFAVPKGGQVPLYFTAFLDYLSKCPAGDSSNSSALIRFITNHPALESYVDRIKQLDLFDSLIRRMSANDRSTLHSKLSSFSTWTRDVINVPALRAVYRYGSWFNPQLRVIIYNPEYSRNQPGCLRFGRNYFSHANYQLILEEAEAAFAKTLESFMHAFLLDIAKEFKNADWFNSLFGNVFGDPMKWNI